MDKPKPLTRAEWGRIDKDSVFVFDDREATELDYRLVATLDALFRYRERTRGMLLVDGYGSYSGTDTIAVEEGIE